MGRLRNCVLRYTKISGLAIGVVTCVFSPGVHGALVALPFSGNHLNLAGEFINGVPVPSGQEEFAPLFASGQTISASVTYDTNQPDTDASPNTGTYRIGMLSVSIPELGLAASRNSSSMQISAFDNCNVCDQFFVFVSGADTFSSNVGLPTPSSFDVLIFGNASMLPNDHLPTNPLNWTFGNVSFDFVASDQTVRQVLMTFTPAVPEPETYAMLLAGLGLMGFVARRRKQEQTA
jgi:hypothetical protein